MISNIQLLWNMWSSQLFLKVQSMYLKFKVFDRREVIFQQKRTAKQRLLVFHFSLLHPSFYFQNSPYLRNLILSVRWRVGPFLTLRCPHVVPGLCDWLAGHSDPRAWVRDGPVLEHPEAHALGSVCLSGRVGLLVGFFLLMF